MSLVNLNEMLADASRRKYAVGMFDVSDIEMVRAVVEEAENLHSPIVLGALEPDLENTRFEYWIAITKLAAENTKIPVCIHLDHANTVDQVMRAANAGFSSVMLDASASPFEENILRSLEVVKAVSGQGISVEAELGHVGNGWSNSDEGSETGRNMLTEPDKVMEFVERTGVNALAVSIGTAHGVYVKAPNLDIDRLKKIAKVSKVPLVLHGGSGTPENQLKNAIENGISKINIYSELLNAWNIAMLTELQKQPHMSVWPSVLRKTPDAAMRAEIRKKIELFGSAGKA